MDMRVLRLAEPQRHQPGPVAFAALTGSLYLGAQFGVFLLLSGVGLRMNLKERKAVSNLVEKR